MPKKTNLFITAPLLALILAGCANTDAYQLSEEPPPPQEVAQHKAELQLNDIIGSNIFYGLNATFDAVVDPNGDGDCDDAVFNDQTIVATESTTVSDPTLLLAFLSDEDYCILMRDGWELYVDPDHDLLTNNWDDVTDQVTLVSDNPMPVSITTGTTSQVQIRFNWPDGIPIRWGLAELGLVVEGGDDCSNECPTLADAPPDATAVCADTGNGSECHSLCETVNGNDDCPISCDAPTGPDTRAYCLRGSIPAPYPGVCVCPAT